MKTITKPDLLDWRLLAMAMAMAVVVALALIICLISAVEQAIHDHPRPEYRLLRLCHESTSDLFLRSDGVRVLKPFIDSPEPDVPVADTVKNEEVCK